MLRTIPLLAFALAAALPLAAQAANDDAAASNLNGGTTFGEALTRLNDPSPPRPGINATLIGEMLPISLSRTQLTSHFNPWPSPSMRLQIDAPLLGQHVFLLEEHREQAGLATTQCGNIIKFNAACILGGRNAGKVEAFATREWTNEQRGGVQLGHTPVYLGAACWFRATNFGLVDLVGGGLGAEILPDFHHKRAFFAHAYYYPNVNNEDPYTDPRTGEHYQLRLGMVRWEAGVTQKLGHSRQYLEAALDGSNEWRLVKVVPMNGTKIKLVLGAGTRL